MDETERAAFEAYEAAHRAGDKEKAAQAYKKWNLEKPLFLSGKATDHIWCMEDIDGYIGVRLDCGDAGTVYFTRGQALELAHQLNEIAAYMR